MKLSISHLAWSAEQDSSMYSCLRDMGFSGLEIAPTRLFPDAPYEKLSEIQAYRERLASEFSLSLSSMQSIWYGRQETLFGDAQQRAFLLGYTKAAVRFAQAAGCRNLVFGSPKSRCVQQPSDLEAGIAFFSELADYAQAHQTVIGLEANPTIYGTNYINTTQEAIRLIRQVGKPGLRLNLDLGTMIANDEQADLLKGSVDLISHVHISEPYLKPIVPHPLHADVLRVLREEGYQGYVSIEMGLQTEMSDVWDIMHYVREAVRDGIS